VTWARPMELISRARENITGHRAVAVLVTVTISLGCIAAHVLGAAVLKRALWGAHFYGFFPPIVLALSLSVLGLGIVVVLRMGSFAPLHRPGFTHAAFMWSGRRYLPLAALLCFGELVFDTRC
jgi:hypothetical protein